MKRGLLKEPIINKGTAVFRRVGGTGGVYDPLTGTWSGGAGSTATAAATAVDPSPEDRARYELNEWRVGSTITLDVEAWDLGTFVPVPNDQLVWGGATYSVREAGAIAPAGVTDRYRIVATR